MDTPASLVLNAHGAMGAPVSVKAMSEIIAKQQEISLSRNKLDLNKVHKVLIEGVSKRSAEHLQGRNSANKVVVFPKKDFKVGQYVDILVTDCTSATLIGESID